MGIGDGHAEYPVLGIRRTFCRFAHSLIKPDEKKRWQQSHLTRWRPLWNSPEGLSGRTKNCPQARFCSRMNCMVLADSPPHRSRTICRYGIMKREKNMLLWNH